MPVRGAYSQTEDGLHRYEEGGNTERLKEDLCRLLPVLDGIEGRLRQQHGMLEQTACKGDQDYMCVYYNQIIITVYFVLKVPKYKFTNTCMSR